VDENLIDIVHQLFYLCRINGEYGIKNVVTRVMREGVIEVV